jgi:hypothetical protein
MKKDDRVVIIRDCTMMKNALNPEPLYGSDDPEDKKSTGTARAGDEGVVLEVNKNESFSDSYLVMIVDLKVRKGNNMRGWLSVWDIKAKE